MLQRFRTYQLRTMFVLVLVSSICFSIWRQVERHRKLAQDHHYECLRAGYSAMTQQGSRFDRRTLQSTQSLWNKSRMHSQTADYFARISDRPWEIVFPKPENDLLPPLPADDANLKFWWDFNVAPHVAYNGLDSDWGTYSDEEVSDRNVKFLNVDPGACNRFLMLTSPELDRLVQ